MIKRELMEICICNMVYRFKTANAKQTFVHLPQYNYNTNNLMVT